MACSAPGPASILKISPGQAKLLATVLQPTLSLYIFLLLVRIVMTWYPNVKPNKLPWVAAYRPTEFFVGPTRRAVPPVGGVDVAPIIWLAIITFVQEILLGPQGILLLLQRKLEL
ncbi:hypothetical protein WJX73_003890 [Symbiochloris irregularis]|uniref:YggT family protein n=1 Tax=Symbiochloris irregularis TaxID=706552 RepID=A0AAW1P9D0_9CHLO